VLNDSTMVRGYYRRTHDDQRVVRLALVPEIRYDYSRTGIRLTTSIRVVSCGYEDRVAVVRARQRP